MKNIFDETKKSFDIFYILGLLVIIGIIILLIYHMIQIKNSKEGLEVKLEKVEYNPKTILKTIIGGTISSKFIYDDKYSTIVRKLIGNNGKTIILVHNTPFNQKIWEPLLSYTQQQLNKNEKIPTIITYDMMGHWSGWVSVDNKYNDNNMNNIAWSLEEFVEQLYGIYNSYVESGKIILVGYGSGGLITQGYTLKYPETIEELYLLGETLGPTELAIPDEVNYLVNWINKHNNVEYLTLEENFVQYNLCIWFENNDILNCPYPQNKDDIKNSYNTFEFLIGQRMYRHASCSTYLQMEKLSNITDLRNEWSKVNINFPIILLVGNRDHYINIETMKKDFEIVKSNNKEKNKSKMYIVNGKHAFPILNTEYIYKLITGTDMDKNELTLQVIN
jgi:pimeloyl-ACP methyl ester carboxylesterase